MQSSDGVWAGVAVQFDSDQVDLGIDHVIAMLADHAGAMTNYAQVLSAAGLPSGCPIGEFVAAFHRRCGRRRLPPLTAMMVHAAGPRRDFPDPVYFAVNGQADPVEPATPIAEKRDATTFWLHQIQTCRLWSARSTRPL